MAQTKVTSYLIPGPYTSKYTRSQAIEGLKQHPDFPKTGNVDFNVEDVEGRWVASIAVAAPFPPAGGEEEAGPPPSDGPPDSDPSDEAPETDGPPSPDDGSDEGDDSGEDKPKKEKGDKGGEHKEITEVHQMLQALCLALGVQLPGGNPADSPVPGDDGPPPPGPDAGPPGPPSGPPPGDTKHPLHPGDTPGGGTPLGAPAFASTNPFAHIAGKVASFRVNEPLGTNSMDEAQAELRSLAAEAGFKVKQIREIRGEDNEARITASLSIY